MITLEMLLNMPALKDLRLVGGQEGLKKEVRTVSVMDAPDSYKWLKGKEFILTSGYLLADDSEHLCFLIEKLIEAGSCALGIKKGRFLHEITDDVLQLAQQHQFPIVEIPYYFVWSDIIAVFYELFYGIPESSDIRISTEYIEELCAAGRFGPLSLMDKLTELFRIPLAVLLDNKQILANNGLPGATLIEHTLEKSKLFPENVDNDVVRAGKYNIIICPIPFIHHGHKEYMAIMSKNLQFLSEMRKLFHLIASLVEKEINAADKQGQIYHKALIDLVAGKLNREGLHALEQQHSSRMNKCHSGIMIINSDDINAVYLKLNKFFRSSLLEEIGKVSAYMVEDASRHEAVIMLELDIKEGDVADAYIQWQTLLFEKMEYYLQEKNEGYVAMGRFSSSVSDIHASYREAKNALHIGRILWESKRCFLSSMVSVYSTLYQYGLSHFDLAYMQRLDNQQSGLSFDGIKTLETYIECANFKKAAAKLFIHENTLRYRIQRIGDFLHLDLDDPVIIQLLLPQVKLWKLMKEAARVDDSTSTID